MSPSRRAHLPEDIWDILLRPVLPLLDLLTGLPRVLKQVHPSQPVLVLELLRSDDAVVNKPEPSGLATSERSLETENDNALRVLHVVHLRDLLRDLSLWNVWPSWVQDIDDELHDTSGAKL